MRRDLAAAQARLLAPPGPLLKLNGALIFQVEAGSHGRRQGVSHCFTILVDFRLGGMASKVAACVQNASQVGFGHAWVVSVLRGSWPSSASSSMRRRWPPESKSSSGRLLSDAPGARHPPEVVLRMKRGRVGVGRVAVACDVHRRGALAWPTSLRDSAPQACRALAIDLKLLMLFWIQARKTWCWSTMQTLWLTSSAESRQVAILRVVWRSSCAPTGQVYCYPRRIRMKEFFKDFDHLRCEVTWRIESCGT